MQVDVFQCNLDIAVLRRQTKELNKEVIPANSDALNVPSFRPWRFEMKLSPFDVCVLLFSRPQKHVRCNYHDRPVRNRVWRVLSWCIWPGGSPAGGSSSGVCGPCPAGTYYGSTGACWPKCRIVRPVALMTYQICMRHFKEGYRIPIIP